MDCENFWISVYLNPKNGILHASADSAYRDLNRTLRGLATEKSIEKYTIVKESMKSLSNDLISTNFESQRF